MRDSNSVGYADLYRPLLAAWALLMRAHSSGRLKDPGEPIPLLGNKQPKSEKAHSTEMSSEMRMHVKRRECFALDKGQTVIFQVCGIAG